MDNTDLVASEMLHRRLALFNRRRLQPGLADSFWEKDLKDDYDLQLSEIKMVEAARECVADWAGQAPENTDDFITWFEDLKKTGPGQGDMLFPWLATRASLEEMRWFLTQEMAGEAGFDDLVAYTQVKLPLRPKLELAKNYWDEMGRGNGDGSHSFLLANVARDLNLHSTIETTVWESLALANLMAALAVHRRYAYLSVGALGVIEMTAPGRVSQVDAGLRRLNISARSRRYFAIHAALDIRHSEGWNREVIAPLITANPRTARLIAEGALLRLSFGARCFERYRRELGLTQQTHLEDGSIPKGKRPVSILNNLEIPLPG